MLINFLIVFSVFVIIAVAFFAYESIKFKNYVTRSFENSFNIPVNKSAPVIAADSIEIAAPVHAVWIILTQINEWPDWQKNVTQANLLGELEEGTQFKWKAGGLSFDSQIHTMVLNKRFGWTGNTMGTRAVHNWKFDSKGNHTIVHVEESLQGVFPEIFRKYFRKNLDQGVKNNLLELKHACEVT